MAVFQDKDKNGKITKTKDGRSWYYISYKNGKHYKSKKYKTQKEAKDEEALFLLKRDMPMNKPFYLVAKDYFNNLYNIRKESTVFTYIGDYNNHIAPFFEQMNISSITIKNVREWAEIMQKKNITVRYMNKVHNILNKIFDFAIKNYDLPTNPSRTYGTFAEKNDKIIEDNQKLRYITLDEFNKFISVIDNSFWKTFFMFAYYTGCRKGEIIALNWNDIDFEKNEISITKTLYTKIKGKISMTSTKTNKNRKITMTNLLRNALLEYKNEVMKYRDFKNEWFIFGNSTYLSSTTIDNNKHKYFKLSGVREITMHEFRHSHVSLLINEYIKSSKEKNMEIDTAKFFLIMSQRMGHSIQVMQSVYMHLFPSVQDEIVNLLNNL